MSTQAKITGYDGPSGGWGSLRGMAKVLLRTGAPASAALTVLRQNKPRGFACVSCAWPKPAQPAPFEFCENGAKATAWETTARRATPEFFAAHTLTELRSWSDYDLERAGRLTDPLRWDQAADRYVPVSWTDAFAGIGAQLRRMSPRNVMFYSSGRTSLEASYMYGLLARLYGCNNLPDSSNMCHESTSVALPASLGTAVGTVRLEDFAHTDCILFFGHNTATNAPRMLNVLQDASRRGVPIIVFNPLRERGLERFKSPQHAGEMLSPEATRIATEYHQLRIGGDIAAIAGICKALFVLEEQRGGVLDHAFIDQHTRDLAPFIDQIRGTSWDEIEHASGLDRAALQTVAKIYAGAQSAIAIYGMGLTQHRAGVDNIHMLVNLLLLRGNIGKPGAGICPVRGHSNVQGQRTVGITEKPELVPNDKLRALYGFDPPMQRGMATVECCEHVIAGKAEAFIGLGGNFVRAVPDTGAIEAAWPAIPLTVHIATTLNRSHVIPGQSAYLLPCLGRIETDIQCGVPQSVSVEDSTACIHGSRGKRTPASPNLLSEPRIVAELAKAALPANPRIDWDRWADDYATIRDAIELTYPDQFMDFNQRLFTPGGFPRPVPARLRMWKTPSGRAHFITPPALIDGAIAAQRAQGVLQLMTIRSNDQFNTTIYGYDDRFRGISKSREILLMNRGDMQRFNVQEGAFVTLRTAVDDGADRRLAGLRVTAYDIPQGCCAGYYPECNCLIPIWHHARESHVPASKSIPVTILTQD